MAQYFPDPEKLKKSKAVNPYNEILNWFAAGNSINLVDDLPEKEYKAALNSIPGLKSVVKQFHPALSENQQFLLMEFLLHGLSEFSQISKSFLDNGFTFKAMFGSLFSSPFDEEDEEDDFNDDRY